MPQAPCRTATGTSDIRLTAPALFNLAAHSRLRRQRGRYRILIGCVSPFNSETGLRTALCDVLRKKRGARPVGHEPLCSRKSELFGLERLLRSPLIATEPVKRESYQRHATDPYYRLRVRAPILRRNRSCTSKQALGNLGNGAPVTHCLAAQRA